MDRVDDAKSRGLMWCPHGVEIRVHDVANQPAMSAYEVVMLRQISVVSSGAGSCSHPDDESQVGECGKGAVHRVQRYRRYPIVHTEVDLLDVGVLVGTGDFSDDLQPLVGQSEAVFPQRARQRIDATVHFMWGNGHSTTF